MCGCGGRNLEDGVLHSGDGDDEEDDAERDGDGGHDLDEVMNLNIEGALVLLSVQG